MPVFFVSRREQTVPVWRPPVDIYRFAGGWILKFELAGVRREDFELRLAQRTVTISGVRRDYMREEGCHCYSMEISYSPFERTIELPTDLDHAQFRMDYKDGLLMVRISLDEGV